MYRSSSVTFWGSCGGLMAILTMRKKSTRCSFTCLALRHRPAARTTPLKKSADDAEMLYGNLAAETVRRNFYVDDCLTSVDREDTAILELIEDFRKTCAYGGFHLTQFVCNRRNVLHTIPVQECESKFHSTRFRTRQPLDRTCSGCSLVCRIRRISISHRTER